MEIIRNYIKSIRNQISTYLREKPMIILIPFIIVIIIMVFNAFNIHPTEFNICGITFSLETSTPQISSPTFATMNFYTETPSHTYTLSPTSTDQPQSTLSFTSKIDYTFTPTFINTPTAILTFTPLATLGQGSTKVNKKDNATMAYVPAGEFKMGMELIKTYTDAFWLYQTEITNSQFVLFLNENDNALQSYDKTAELSYIHNNNDVWVVQDGKENFPVVNINWYGANAYCEWAGGSLPSEIQWEKGARGFTERMYPWGNESPNCQLANYYDCINNITEVGSYPYGISAMGAYDMAGNVYEWVLNLASDGSINLFSDENRVIKGGSWKISSVEYMHISYDLGFFSPRKSTNHIGFRCVIPVKNP